MEGTSGGEVLQIISLEDGTKKGTRVFKMVLTDGTTKIKATISPIPETTNSNDYTPGTQVRLNNAVMPRPGKVRLTLKDLTVLGASTERQKKRKGESVVKSSIKRTRRELAEDQEKPSSSDTRGKQDHKTTSMNVAPAAENWRAENDLDAKAIIHTLTTRGWYFRDLDYIQYLVTSLDRGGNQSSEFLESAVESKLLKMDLNSIGGKTLPDPSDLHRFIKLHCPKILQISYVEGVTRKSGKQVFNMVLTDGINKVSAKISPVPEINYYTPGTKVRLNKAVMSGGILSLTPEDLTVCNDKNLQRKSVKVEDSVAPPPTVKEKWFQSLYLLEDSESPVVWNHGAPEEDDEFEGFLFPNKLRLEVDKSVKDGVVRNLFHSYRVTINPLEEEEEPECKVLEITFETPALAKEALSNFKSDVLNNKPVFLTRMLKVRHMSYCVSGFSKNLELPEVENIMKKEFKKYGDVLKVVRPEGNNSGYCYVYLYLKDKLLPQHRCENDNPWAKVRIGPRRRRGGGGTENKLWGRVSDMKPSFHRQYANELAKGQYAEYAPTVVESSIKRTSREKGEISVADGNKKGSDKNLQRNPADSDPVKSVKVEDQEKPSSSDTRRKQEEENENLRLLLVKAREKLGTRRDRLLTKADLPDDWMAKETISLSWKIKRRDLIRHPCKQKTDDCWAIAYSEGIYAKYKLLSLKNPPSPSDLLKRIDPKYLTEKMGLKKPEYAMDFLKQKYGINMKVYYRPPIDSPEQLHQEFELLIERLLAKSPVTVAFAFVDGYSKLQPEHKKFMFRPYETDKASLRYEELEWHCVTLYAHGAVFKGDTCIQFWEGQDDFWPGKLIRFERHQRLITEVYDFEVEGVQQTTRK